ncbi:hypothetical protein [Deinococcus aquaedulcis]|uniref:hypothetical protein n=1 Tax=Deinococcus aquaedulcis TaxID=2840455 RepID=UPI001C833BFD|nr:hypothetical protein [Deinococcus aquaedulcis]
MSTCVHRLTVALALLGTTALANPASIPVDQAYLDQQARQLTQAITEAVSEAGGNLDSQQLHLVFAFSTGHFAKDPLMAEAARVIASNVAEQHLVNGDQLSAYAWEMTVWPHKGQALNPFTVGSDRAALRASFQDLWPRSAQAGSEGGHDTEAAITQLTQTLGDSRNAVLVLLTNSAASVAGTQAQRTIGENDPAYLSALEQWTRVRTSNTTGASLQLGIRDDQPNRTFDAVIVVPKAFEGAALSGSREDLIRTQTAEAPGSQSPARGLPSWIWALPVLAVVGALLYGLSRRRRVSGSPAAPRVRAGKGNWTLQVAGRTYALKDVQEGEPVCIICGPGYPIPPSNPSYVLLSSPTLPPVKLLTIRRTGKTLTVQPDLDIALEEGSPQSIPAGQDADYTLSVRGRAASKPNLPPKPFAATVNIAIRPEES